MALDTAAQKIYNMGIGRYPFRTHRGAERITSEKSSMKGNTMSKEKANRKQSAQVAGHSARTARIERDRLDGERHMRESGFSSAVGEIEQVIGYIFTDKSLLCQAFTRTSYCNEHGGGRLQSNEVLEFFGDAVLSVAIISHLLSDMVVRYEYGIHTELTEGDLSNIKSRLSDKKNLSDCMRGLGLAEHLLLGEGDVKLGVKNEPSVMEDLFESIIGAVYIDSGMSLPSVMTVVSRMLNVGEYTDRTPPIQSAKNALQEWCADKRRRLPPPVYKTVSEDGPDHKKVYERGVYIGERMVATGRGKNMKLADAAAAEGALAILRTESGDTKKAQKANNSSQSAFTAKTANKTIKETKAAENSTRLPSAELGAAGVSKAVNDADGGINPTEMLRNIAKERGIAPPSYKDLGRAVADGGETYRIECLVGGSGAVVTGRSREEAREAAARGVIKCLEIGAGLTANQQSGARIVHGAATTKAADGDSAKHDIITKAARGTYSPKRENTYNRSQPNAKAKKPTTEGKSNEH